MKVFDYIEVKETGIIGRIVILFGFSVYTELYADMFPGADDNYEYMYMWDENEQKVCLRALNKYKVEEVKVISKRNYNKQIKHYYSLARKKRIGPKK